MLTPEDFDIWLRVAHAPDTQLAVRHLYTRSVVTGDRRDAELMLRAQYQRRWLPASGSVPALPRWLLPVEWSCGPVGGDIARYITSCA
jgi:hypothetical protein